MNNGKKLSGTGGDDCDCGMRSSQSEEAGEQMPGTSAGMGGGDDEARMAAAPGLGEMASAESESIQAMPGMGDMESDGEGQGNGDGNGNGNGNGNGMTGGGGSGGQPKPTRRCGTMDVHRRLLSTSPEYAAARAQVESEVMSLQSRFQERSAERGVQRIPVVVHVVFNTAAENISDAQVKSQIDVLNRDFRATNPDVSTVPPVFKPLVKDCEVEFFLATQDPNGAPHSGIIRKSTTSTSFGPDDKVKASASGGSDPWPADRYLNMWVCELTGGLLGYAQFPGGPASTDGVVITHSAFGTTGTATPPFHLGRTATHEIGHYLDLFHIWGDDGQGCTGSDQVGDTPNQGGENLGTPTFPRISCNNGPNGDLFMNYMDYVDDPVMVMFTAGQVARMQACLAGPRASLGASTRITPAGPVVSWGPNRLDAFVLGTNSALYHKWWNGSSWGPSVTGYENLGGVCSSPAEVASWGRDRLDAFVIGTDSALYHKWWNGSSWGPSVTGYEKLGGVCISPPRAVTWGANRLDVFVTGTDSALYHKWWNGSSWGPSLTGYERLGGVCLGGAEAVAWGPNRLDAFVLGTNRALYHKWWNGSSWGPSLTGYENLGGTCASAPKAVAWGPNRLDVFVIGTNRALYHKWWNGSSWGPSVTGWESLGGVCLAQPEVVSWGANRLDLFVIGTDRALYHKAWNGSAWTPSVTGWTRLGGVCTGVPHAASWGANRLDVFVTGTDSALYHKWYDGSTWGPSLTGFERLGGVITDFRAPGIAEGVPLAAAARRPRITPPSGPHA